MNSITSHSLSHDSAFGNWQHYQTIAKAIEFVRANARQQPSLHEVAYAVGMSESHLQRVFTEWAGISPKRFLQFLTKEHALQCLEGSQDVMSVALDTGLSGSGRLHDLLVSCEAMTPGEIKALGNGLEIGYGQAQTPFGDGVIGWTQRGICYLAFVESDSQDHIQHLAKLWPEARLQRDNAKAADWFKQIFVDSGEQRSLHLLVRGTNFQIKVWEALLKIGRSQIVSYSQLAQLAGSPKAQRAVGSAMAVNNIAYLIPCHRVIRGDGDSGQYRWDANRKRAMQAWEAGHAEAGLTRSK